MSALWLAISLTVLIAFTGVATDSGLVWITRSVLQNSVDAGALAAAQDLAPLAAGGGQTTATNTACVYATQRNAVPGMTGSGCSGKADVVFLNNGSTIKVTSSRTVQPIFGAVVGWNPVQVSASASARVGSVKQSSCYFPLFQTKTMMASVWNNGTGTITMPPVPTKLKPNASGAVLAIQVNGSSSSSDWRDTVSSPDGCSHEIGAVGSTIPTNPGTFAGPLNTAMVNRQALWMAQGNCVQPDPGKAPYTIKPDGTVWNGSLQLNTKNCYRMVLMPIGDQENKPVKVIAFAVFWIGGFCDNQLSCSSTPPASLTMGKNEVWGYFVGFSAPGGTDYGTYDGYGTKVVGLVP
ncbi:MAG TPA: Tad domain-containing protein [Thermomicrobiales bacterium]|nr:Tad domain-containing protein [Thermomicrobiales bacterium]